MSHLSRIRRRLPFVLGSVVMLTLAIVLIRVRYQLEMSRETVHLQALLVAAATETRTSLARGQQVADHPDDAHDRRWHAWGITAPERAGETRADVPVTEAAVRRQLLGRADAAGVPLLLGPFGTELGQNAFVVAVSTGGGAWQGAWTLAEDLMSGPALADLARGGYSTELYDPTHTVSLYGVGTEQAPLSVPLRFGATQLELRGSPRRLPSRFLSSTLLTLLAVLLWLSYELRRDTALNTAAGDLAEADNRRREVNARYGQALETVALLESQLHLVSMYDAVTGLANRSSLLRRIDSALEAMRQSPQGSLGVVAIGFDHVNHITHAFGAEFASRVLVIAAERVEHVLPSRHLLFRTGDFTLAAVLPQTDNAQLTELARKVAAEIESPIGLDSHTFMLQPSIGIVETRSGYEYAETLLDHAITAQGAVQRDAPVRHCLFDSSAAKDSISRLQLEADLERAFVDEELLLEYEPFVAPGSYTVAGFEALIRWDHPTEGRLGPGRFVPIAMQAGMSHRLNEWVLRGAARQAGAWHEAGYRDFFINFNLSAEAFLRPNLAEEVGAVLAEFDVPGRHLIVELTESTLIQDIRAAARTLQRLADLGVRAWLDDFGTGYSSLSHLRTLPLKGVKIDRSFIERIVIDARDAGFVKALIDLIGYLGLESIAEGIETREQYELLSLTTCDLYQGYHFARSMPASQAERWLNDAGRSLERRIVV